MPCGSETILRVKNTTICCGFVEIETAAYGGWFSRFGFVAVFRAGNEVGIDENISVGYKAESMWTFLSAKALCNLALAIVSLKAFLLK